MAPKPGDHPDFFRFPAPEGRSRESSIVLDEHGRFWHDGRLVEHAGMARAFAGWIDRHPDDGRYILNNGYDWTYFEVKDAPFFVRGVSDASGAPLLQLSDGSEEPLDAATLCASPSGAVRCQVKQRRFPAKFSPTAQTQLAPWLIETTNGEIEIEVGGQSYPIPPA